MLSFCPVAVHASEDYQVFVSNEKAGTLTLISGDGFKVTATVTVGKRSWDIALSPDGKYVSQPERGIISLPLRQVGCWFEIEALRERLGEAGPRNCGPSG